MSFPRYAKYKDSGVEWLGAVPEHWEVLPLKRRFRIVGGSTPKSENGSFWDGDILWATPADLSKRESLEINDTRRKITAEGLASCGTTLVPTKSIILSTRAPIGSLAIAGNPMCTNQGCKSLVPFSSADAKYFTYMLSISSSELNIRGKGTTFLELSGDELGAFNAPAPPVAEQSTIAAFLDRETAKIDELVVEQQRLIKLLKEKRHAVISHAVTKGLNPHAHMKPSGIEWLGDLPEHWQYGPLRRFWEAVDCKHLTVPFLDEGFPVASVMEVRTFELDLSQVLRTSEEFYKFLISGDRQPLRGDVIYCRNTANTGTSAYVGTDEPIAMGQDVSLIKSRRHNGRYLNYILHGDSMKQQLETIMVGSTFKRINVADIKALIVVCPPRREQDEIVEFIESQTATFDTLTAEAQRAIELLQERRTALISAAVTGKIDVRG